MKWTAQILGLLLLALATPTVRADFTLDAFKAYPLPADSGDVSQMVVADVTGDGRSDVLTLSIGHEGWLLTLLPQLPSGGLAAGRRIMLPDSGSSGYDVLRVADLDGDGRDEIITGGSRGLLRIVLRGLRATTSKLSSDYAEFADIADMDGDGRMDIVTSRFQTGDPQTGGSVLFGDGHGGIARVSHFAIPRLANVHTAMGDLNGDGALDYVLASEVATIYLNRGDGSFAQAETITPDLDRSIGTLLVGDVNGDQRDDLVLGKTSNSPTVLAVYEQGPSGLSLAKTLPTLDLPYNGTIGDIDGDGRQDVALIHAGWAAVGLYLQGPEGLTSERLYTLPFVSFFDWVAIVDMNGDGCRDLVASRGTEINIFAAAGCQPIGDLAIMGSLSGLSAEIEAKNLGTSGTLSHVVVDITLESRSGTLALGKLPVGCTTSESTPTTASTLAIRCKSVHLRGLASASWNIDYTLTGAGPAARVELRALGQTKSPERVLTNNRLYRTWTSLRSSR